MDKGDAHIGVRFLAVNQHLKYLVLLALPLLLAQQAVEHALAIAVGIAGIGAELQEQLDDLRARATERGEPRACRAQALRRRGVARTFA